MTKKGHNFPRVKGSGSQSAVLGPEAQDQDHWEMCQTWKFLGPTPSSKSETEAGDSNLCSNKPSRLFPHMLMFENH